MRGAGVSSPLHAGREEHFRDGEEQVSGLALAIEIKPVGIDDNDRVFCRYVLGVYRTASLIQQQALSSGFGLKELHGLEAPARVY
jgi:hypothetical protein